MIRSIVIEKLTPFREFFDLFVGNYKNGLSVSEYVTLDEIPDMCNFRQFILSKSNKYGIKIFVLCDAKTFYTSNIEVSVAEKLEWPYKESISANNVVERLGQIIKDSGRNVTLCN